MPLPVAQAIEKLPVGGVTTQSVALGKDGAYAILRVDAVRPTQVPTFDQTKDTLRQQLQALALEKAAAQFTAGLVKSATIQQ